MAKNQLFSTVDELLPHEGSIILITDVIDWGDDWLEAAVDHRRSSMFIQKDGTVPVWVGIEYMAQTIGALVGIRSKLAGEPIRIGFLMGAQKYESTVPCFAKDSVLTVRVEEVFSDRTSLAMFDCSISSEEVLATAQIKAIRPEDPDIVFRGMD